MSDNIDNDLVDAVELAEQYLREHPEEEKNRQQILDHARRIGKVRKKTGLPPSQQEPQS